MTDGYSRYLLRLCMIVNNKVALYSIVDIRHASTVAEVFAQESERGYNEGYAIGKVQTIETNSVRLNLALHISLFYYVLFTVEKIAFEKFFLKYPLKSYD